MCGLAGFFDPLNKEDRRDLLDSMISEMAYRGPDNKSIFQMKGAGLAHVRLSIIDLMGGTQPVHNEDKTIYVVFTGEIFNYIELREQLLKNNHKFYTKTDTEVIVHLYEEYGTDFVNYLNGQFAFALWDSNKDRLVLARDRLGIRPLFYHFHDSTIYFSSEIKSLLKVPGLCSQIDPQAVLETFTYWTMLPGRSLINEVSSLEPGQILIKTSNGISKHRYWDWKNNNAGYNFSNFDVASQELYEHIEHSVNIQLRSDVPVGVYLSGGIDSAIIFNLARKKSGQILDTFSLGFEDEELDESYYQKLLSQAFNSRHHQILCRKADIARKFPEVMKHLEMPILRAAPVPLYMLSRYVHDSGYKVVLSGEGADEVFYGYDIFKEANLRNYFINKGNTRRTGKSFEVMYPYMKTFSSRYHSFNVEYFLKDAEGVSKKYLSHLTRWNNSEKLRKFLNKDIYPGLDSWSPYDAIEKHLPQDIDDSSFLESGQYIEAMTLLSGYILSCQGDRVSMANAVEGRYPFLDHELIKFAGTLPDNFKLFGMKEKYILKKMFVRDIPEEIINRPKQPYRVPGAESFLTDDRSCEYVDYLFSKERLKDSGIFDVKATELFYRKFRSGKLQSAVDNMAFIGILSTMALDELFVRKSELTV